MSAAPDSALPVHWIIEVASPDETFRLADDLAMLLRGGDLVTLGGGLGVGKTTLARALIRALVGDPRLEVPSPTFTLIQSYDTPRFPIVHADLYRLESPEELETLGWNEISDDTLLLVEWAERAGAALAPDRLDISLQLDGASESQRLITITGHGAFAQRVGMARSIHQVLRRSGYGTAVRQHLQGDASTRAYERLIRPDGVGSAVLMIAPKRPDGPPVRGGRPYSQVAKLAEDIRPFLALARGLEARGFSAPTIYGVDLAAGLIVLEDLGNEGVAENAAPIAERYLEAVAALAALHSLSLPETLPVAEDRPYTIPHYDLEALLMETELLIDWYLPHMGNAALSVTARIAFGDLWTATLAPVLAAPLTWTLRDYHSPNLIWLPDREGIQRVGIIDFQDCVLGPPAYDVASLAQDARLDVPDDLELRMLSHYVRLRREADPAFDTAAFAHAYAVMGAQRATKILGIFARLNKRDGKPQYLKHLPRIERNIRRCLAHPALEPLLQWYRTHIPALFAKD
ncbi:MAG: tRNA (adenosine(37)-N6)-threonylcarbamoyltransferase complex ATPase subunit type 1 TsaE [Proteobacteria bacterium]|nr:tRNA (adenosine(37)-N6)-threonylcarbamoyltransferase complex ATPase subunit type 1 TsaE [Pseudomonadota bacterium]